MTHQFRPTSFPLLFGLDHRGSFLTDLFDTRWIAQLADEDLQMVDALGTALTTHDQEPRLATNIWFLLADAYNTRGAKQKEQDLLARIYRLPTTNLEEKQKIALRLAYRAAREEPFLALYIDCLQQSTNTPFKTELLQVLTRANLWNASFDSDQATLQNSYDIAQRFLQADCETVELVIAHGLYLLLVQHNAAAASLLFGRAIHNDTHNALAQTGLLVSLLKQGAYQKAADTARRLAQTEDQVITTLKYFALALSWLNAATNEQDPPVTVNQLLTTNVRQYIGEIADITIARLALIEGDATRASRLLCDPTADEPAPFNWLYYHAWGKLLLGDSQGLVACFNQAETWKRRWMIGCLLLESNPALLNHSQTQALLQNAPAKYIPVVQARIALSLTTPLTVTSVLLHGDSLEENLEALRTALGIAFYHKNASAMDDLLAQPLFRRLPLADRLTWNGLHALLGHEDDQTNRFFAHQMLKDAALHYNYPRAALLLATLQLEQGALDNIEQLLTIAAAGRNNHPKIELLRNYCFWQR